MKSLLIDIGSTFIKYCTYNILNKQIEKEEKIPFPVPCLDDGGRYEVKSEDIKKLVLDIFDKRADCEKAFISVQMHGYVMKTENGFENYVSWRDKSGDVTDSRLDGVDFDAMGTSKKQNLPLVKLAFKDIDGEFFTLGSFIAYTLTGKNETHITDAAASGFFLRDTCTPNGYQGKMKMPTVAKSVKPIGKYKGITVYTPIGDHQISVLGSEINRNKYLVNIGTATQISCVDTKEHPNGQYEKRPYFDSEILYTVSGLVGGHTLYKGEGIDELYAQLVDAIKKLPKKSEILFGGGGAKSAFEKLKGRLEKIGIKSSITNENIGQRGLIKMANQNKLNVGTMLSEITFPNFPIIAKQSGLDFIIIDNEHGCFDYSHISALIMNANLIGLDAIVRVGSSDRGHITKLADMGVHGFLLPMTNTADDIKQVVNYAKYTPIGKRGVSTTRAHTLYNPPELKEYMTQANEKMKVYAQIETLAGVENIDSILALEGVDGVLVGPNDLSVDLNCIGDNKTLLTYIERVAVAANKIGKPWGIITANKELLAFSTENNAKFVSVGSELNMLLNGCKKIAEQF